MSDSPIIVWLRNDLRLADNPALHAAAESGSPVILLYILPESSFPHYPGSASRWWLAQSLRALQTTLADFNQQLIMQRGHPTSILMQIARESHAKAVYWNRHLEPSERELEQDIITELNDAGVLAEDFPSNLLISPEELLTGSGNPYQVFTPFWKSAQRQCTFSAPLTIPRYLPAPRILPTSLTIQELELDPQHSWTAGISESWQVGEIAATEVLNHFLAERAHCYQDRRNIPSVTGTSRLSPYLHFGEITPRQIYTSTMKQKETFQQEENLSAIEQCDTFLSEIGWREFSHYVLFHFPHTSELSLRAVFDQVCWEDHPQWLKAWQRGQTGYPIIDAGMRELWQTGWMHNRVRMIVASFLTKHLQIDWREGANWFWDTLVDADLANNTMGWQWAAGCGADAAPYFRIFNPVLQSEKFDPSGEYIRHWCPELSDLPEKYIHNPGTAPPLALRQAKVQLGDNYPLPIVNLKERRELALRKWEQIKALKS